MKQEKLALSWRGINKALLLVLRFELLTKFFWFVVSLRETNMVSCKWGILFFIIHESFLARKLNLVLLVIMEKQSWLKEVCLFLDVSFWIRWRKVEFISWLDTQPCEQLLPINPFPFSLAKENDWKSKAGERFSHISHTAIVLLFHLTCLFYKNLPNLLI